MCMRSVPPRPPRLGDAGPQAPASARAPQDPPTSAQRSGSLEHVVGLGPQLVLDRLRALSRMPRQRVGVGLDHAGAGHRRRATAPRWRARRARTAAGRRRCAGRRARRCWRTGCPAPRRRAAALRRRCPAGSSAIMEAAVTLSPRTCMQTLTPLPSAPTRAGGAWTGPPVPGAPHGPVPWSRRWAAVAAAVSPPESARGEETAAGRQADIGVGACPRRGRGTGRSRPPVRGRPRRASSRCRA